MAVASPAAAVRLTRGCDELRRRGGNSRLARHCHRECLGKQPFVEETPPLSSGSRGDWACAGRAVPRARIILESPSCYCSRMGLGTLLGRSLGRQFAPTSRRSSLLVPLLPRPSLRRCDLCHRRFSRGRKNGHFGRGGLRHRGTKAEGTGSWKHVASAVYA